MNLHLSFRNVRVSRTLYDYVVKKVRRLEAIAGEIIAAHVVVLRFEHAAAGRRYCVKAHLVVAGPNIHASSDGGGPWEAIDQLGDTLASQLRRRKTRLRDHRRDGRCMEEAGR